MDAVGYALASGISISDGEILPNLPNGLLNNSQAVGMPDGTIHGISSSSHFKYNPIDGSSVIKTPNPYNNGSYAAAVVAQNGNIYIHGGYSGGEVNTLSMYDPVTNTWTSKTSGASGRRWHALTPVGASTLWCSPGFNNQTTWYSYDINTNVWTYLGSISGYTGNQHVASTVNGNVWVCHINGSYLILAKVTVNVLGSTMTYSDTATLPISNSSLNTNGYAPNVGSSFYFKLDASHGYKIDTSLPASKRASVFPIIHDHHTSNNMVLGGIGDLYILGSPSSPYTNVSKINIASKIKGVSGLKSYLATK